MWPRHQPDARCPHCGSALSELSRRGGAAHCGAARCRQAADERRAAIRREATTVAVLATLPPSPRAPLVVWLQHHDAATVPLSDDERERHAAYLDRVVAEAIVIEPSRLADSTAEDSHPQGGHLCSQCRGRCCQHGAEWHAFIDLNLLQRWQQAHPDQDTQAAAQAYLSLLPAQHVEQGCLYQTQRGCALPREWRADICNGFACPPLQQVQKSASSDPDRSVLVLSADKHAALTRAALINAHGVQTLARPADSAAF